MGHPGRGLTNCGLPPPLARCYSGQYTRAGDIFRDVSLLLPVPDAFEFRCSICVNKQHCNHTIH
ncbi:hypothetical protein DPMN_168995 [Dreissena polymorpha]|uniref:Uncharacterized protein n=1 Tax=Dreissena polymorpha TaxID=45954 RepID=A0A9D4J060_DREPO|nr:hypothetical protein DPMN_168995 [Dreissena polymorpha]